jgi:hypothetical protein
MKKGFLIFFAVLLIISAIIFGLAQHVVTSAPAYPHAIQYIEASNEVVSKIGKVTGYGFSKSYKQTINGENRVADFQFIVSGEKGKAKVSIRLALDSAGIWEVQSFVVN